MFLPDLSEQGVISCASTSTHQPYDPAIDMTTKVAALFYIRITIQNQDKPLHKYIQCSWNQLQRCPSSQCSDRNPLRNVHQRLYRTRFGGLTQYHYRPCSRMGWANRTKVQPRSPTYSQPFGPVIDMITEADIDVRIRLNCVCNPSGPRVWTEIRCLCIQNKARLDIGTKVEVMKMT